MATVERATPQIAINVDPNGATVYMTRQALRDLVVKLNRMIEADPAECFEVHLGMHFSVWQGETLVYPAIAISEELRPVLVDGRQADLDADIASGEIDADVTPAPFEVTLMHVSPEAVAEQSARVASISPTDTASR